MSDKSNAKEQVRALLTPSENLAVGAFGGAFETCAQMPLLTYKFCTQEGRPLPTNMAGWYRGVGAQAGSVAPITAIQMVANGVLESILSGGGRRNLSDIEKIGTSMGAGTISALAYSPVDLVTIQQQKLNKGIMETVNYIRLTYGNAALYRGLFAMVGRESIYACGYLGVTPVLVPKLMKLSPTLAEHPVVTTVLGSCMSGIVAALITHPIDTVKTVVQADVAKKQFRNGREVVPFLWNRGGIQEFYRGGAARSARLIGAFFIVAVLREKAVQYKTEEMKREGLL